MTPDELATLAEAHGCVLEAISSVVESGGMRPYGDAEVTEFRVEGEWLTAAAPSVAHETLVTYRIPVVDVLAELDRLTERHAVAAAGRADEDARIRRFPWTRFVVQPEQSRRTT